MKTRIVKPQQVVENWYLIDAKGQRLGNLASIAAQLLLGKDQPSTRAYLMPKSKVVVINAANLDISPKKAISELYTRYSGYPGGLTTNTLGEMMDKDPKKVIQIAIKGMMPKNKRAEAIVANNLYIHTDANHGHEAQAASMINVDIQNFKI